ncbi:sialidase domain-containing protein [Clostridium sp.]|uniref:sialidase domain-containing protein n=1 Tax=Clostridium sp. TaxID=1506 RepID=UPI002FC6C04B
MKREKIIAITLATVILSGNITNMVFASQGVGVKKPVIEREIPRGELSVKATSQQSSDPATNAIDGNLESIWHTPWDGSEKLPQSLELNLGKERNISSIKINSRTSGDNGKIKKYEIISADKVVKSGTLKTSELSHVIRFDEPIKSDNLTIKVLEGVSGYASIAEVNVYEAEGIAEKVVSYENLRIKDGNGGAFNGDAEKIKTLEEGTVIARFDNKNDGIQTILGVSNNTRGASHFHIYVSGGKLGYEIRSDDGTSFNINGSASVTLNKGINTVAFKAQKGVGYTIYLNGEKVHFNNRASSEFISSIKGINSVNVGRTDRSSGNEYNFTGDIDFVNVYGKVLSDDYLIRKTGETKLDKLPLPDGAYLSEPVDVFKPNDLGSKAYRIPSLLTTQNGTLIAGIDARISHGGDSPNNIDAAVKRSEDGGATWIDGKKIIDYPGSASVIDSALLQNEDGKVFLFITAFPEGYGFGASRKGTGFEEFQGENCMLLYDGEGTTGQAAKGNKYYIKPGGRVYDSNGGVTKYRVDANNYLYEDGKAEAIGNTFLPSSKLKAFGTAYLALVESTDDGKTWSDPKLISGQVKKDWMKFLGTGPGRGIQIKTGSKKGRLVFPVYYTNPSGFQSSAVIYSDDNGKTWDIGESPNDSRSDHAQNSDTITNGNQLTECQVVEMPNGQLKLFMRNTGSYVRIATSFDGGETWHEEVSEDRDLREPYCQLSVINYSKLIDGKPAVIFANPNADNRSNGTVRIGLIEENGVYSNGEKKYTFDWKYNQSIVPGYYAYSCLTELKNGDVGVFYEGTGSEEMSYRKMNTDFIKANLVESAVSAKVDKVELIDKKESYAKGEEFKISVKFNQSVSLIGNRDIKIGIGSSEATLKMTENKDGSTLIFTGTIPESIKDGDYKMIIKAQDNLELVTTTGKVSTLNSDIDTKVNINIKNDSVVEVDKTSLKMAIDYAKDAERNGALEGVIPKVVKAFKGNLKAAEEVFENENATAENVDIAFKNLMTSIHMLEFKQGDKKELQKIVDIIDSLEKDNYILSTWSKLEEALGESKKVIADENAMQKEVNDSFNKLMKAYLDLRLSPDKSKLEELINEVKDIDLSKYTKESVDLLNVEIDNAKEVLNDEEATQEEVDNSIKSLERTVKNLKEKTDKPIEDEKPSDEKPKDDNIENPSDLNKPKEPSKFENNNIPSTGMNTGLMSLFGVITSAVGATFLRKKK